MSNTKGQIEMSDIGTFKIMRDDNGIYSGRGRIRTMETHIEGIQLKSIDYGPRGRPEDAPSHSLSITKGADTIQIGNAWERKLERGDFEGRNMYSFAFNDPGLPEWMGNLACFPRDEDGNYTVVYNRKRAGRGDGEASS